MSDQQPTPFEILGISPSAEQIVVQAAYRALARKYHPDMNPGISPDELNRRMTKINWAKEELERDLEGWRRRATSSASAAEAADAHKPSGERRTPYRPTSIVEVEPQVINLPGRRGSSALFAARASGVEGETIRARFETGTIDVERVDSRQGLATFRVAVTEDFASDIEDSDIETIEVVAPGFMGSKAFVCLAPVNRKILDQQYPDRIAPPRHPSVTARISFGKHRGRMFNEIAVNEPGYLHWMLREGAGTGIERQSAQMALGELEGGTALPPTRRQGRRQIARSPSSSPPQRSLPDPNRPGGLLGTLRALFSPRQRR